jgi:hypothetical protein
MHMTKLVAAMAVLSLTAGTAMANPVVNPAAGLSLSGDESGGGKAAGGHHTTTLVIAGLAVAGVVGGAIALGTGHHGTPASS